MPYLLRERAGHPDLRVPADPGLASRRSCASTASSRRRPPVAEGDTQRLGAVRPRVRRGQPLDPRRARGGDPHRRPDSSCCTPATSRWTSCRSTGGSPTCALSPGSATKASTCCWSTRPTPRCPGSSRRRRTSFRRSSGLRPDAERRIIVASFASHIHRVQQIIDVATAHGRKVAFVGRSMVRNMKVARDLGYLTIPADTVVDVKAIDDLPDDEVVLMCTGLAGRADGGPVADRRPRPQDPGRRRRHRDPGVVADPRQRERRVPRDQRAHCAGAPPSCTRATPWCTSRVTPPPASCCTCTTWSSPRT